MSVSDLEVMYITDSLDLRKAPILIEALMVDKQVLIERLNELLNDCINFDGGKLTDFVLQNASDTLKHYRAD